MQTITSAQQQRAISASPAVLPSEIPALATLPVTRIKMNDEGVLQLRAGNVTGPTGMRFSRVEVRLNVDTLKYSGEAVLPNGRSVTLPPAQGQHKASMDAIFDLVDRTVSRAADADAPAVTPKATAALLDVQEYGTEYRRTGGVEEWSVDPTLTRKLASAEGELARQTHRAGLRSCACRDGLVSRKTKSGPLRAPVRPSRVATKASFAPRRS